LRERLAEIRDPGRKGLLAAWRPVISGVVGAVIERIEAADIRMVHVAAPIYRLPANVLEIVIENALDSLEVPYGAEWPRIFFGINASLWTALDDYARAIDAAEANDAAARDSQNSRAGSAKRVDIFR
jgi:hypothetical protein